MKTVNLGGDRLGSGNKMKVQMRNYERSTHNLGNIWRSTMAVGTLVPFMKQVGLPGDTFDIELNADVKTLPTVGPLFGSFKLQLDVFMCPIRLYNAQLHMNRLDVGMNMKNVKFPQIRVISVEPNNTKSNKLQLSQSSLLAYLGIRYTGQLYKQTEYSKLTVNAMPYLMYFDIFKNYYANKQEKNAYIIDNDAYTTIEECEVNGELKILPLADPIILQDVTVIMLQINGNKFKKISTEDFEFIINSKEYRGVEIFQECDKTVDGYVRYANPKTEWLGKEINEIELTYAWETQQIKLTSFPITNIDTMKENILKQSPSSEMEIDFQSIIPYNIPIYNTASQKYKSKSYYNLVGLLTKTYQSDIFNNWLNTETIAGATGINEISKVSTASGGFTIDALQLAKKVYDVMNRIAVSGGTYEDWLQAVYDHQAMRRVESPVYMGGLSKEVVFQEVVSSAATDNEPLATLAGRGNLSQKHKGGKIVIKVDEPCYIMGIVSLTPRVDYSQGNDWDTDLKTMDDLHKPGLDGIGFQDLPTWKMHGIEKGETVYSAGKQPAWLDYMTNYNKTYGEFANPDTQMFMTLNRRYELDDNNRIKDLTTYIDPAKYNYIFADTRLDAQNFWLQIATDITARRKMSAKIMPNL